MKNIESPSDDYLLHCEEFKSLVAKKNKGHEKTRLVNMSSKIHGRYKEYLTNKAKVESVAVVRRVKSSIVALESCYKNSAKFKSDHIEKPDPDDPGILPRCPYCQIGFADTFDHYLPSSIYPDFFVFIPNLIRVCSSCNETKGNKTILPDRGTINPFFDDLQSTRYLQCKPVYQEGILAVNFRIEPTPPLGAGHIYVHSIVKRHFDYYGLNEKFRAEASGKITELKNEINILAEYVNIDAGVIQNVIGKRIAEEVKKFGHMNSWELALWEGLLIFPGTNLYLLRQI